MSGIKLWVVCPSYTDVPSFVILRERILQALSSLQKLPPPEVRFVVVDDTAGFDIEIDGLKEYLDVDVITPPFNLGHQRAIVYGLRLMLPDVEESDLIVTMDADGEDRPEDLPRLIEPLIAAPDERGMLCVARRTKRSETLQIQSPISFLQSLVPHSDRYHRAQRKLPRPTAVGSPNECCRIHTSTSVIRPHSSAWTLPSHRYPAPAERGTKVGLG